MVTGMRRGIRLRVQGPAACVAGLPGRAVTSPESPAGSSVDDWDERVRDEFVGAGYCTHLNCVLRTLTRVPLISAAYRLG
jgi:hypothetical protein